MLYAFFHLHLKTEIEATFKEEVTVVAPTVRVAETPAALPVQPAQVMSVAGGGENIFRVLQTLPGVSRAEQRRRCDALMEQFGLKVKAREEARTCSGGERRRLEIARALITNPKLMLLDEPFAAVDPHTVEELQAEVRKLAARGIAVLVTDHNVQQTLRICDRAYIIHQGRNLREGDPKSIINDPMVREAYLASTFRGDEFD